MGLSTKIYTYLVYDKESVHVCMNDLMKAIRCDMTVSMTTSSECEYLKSVCVRVCVCGGMTYLFHCVVVSSTTTTTTNANSAKYLRRLRLCVCVCVFGCVVIQTNTHTHIHKHTVEQQLLNGGKPMTHT